MIQNKREEGSQEPCSKNTDQVPKSTFDSRSSWNRNYSFSTFSLNSVLRDTRKKSKQGG